MIRAMVIAELFDDSGTLTMTDAAMVKGHLDVYGKPQSHAESDDGRLFALWTTATDVSRGPTVMVLEKSWAEDKGLVDRHDSWSK